MAMNKQCAFWDCIESIQAGHVFCYDHYQDLLDGLIDECPDCHRAKHNQYDVCLDCYNNRSSGRSRRPERYSPEHSPAWAKEDANADQFFVYILRLNGGNFYAGQTRELRERLSEHKDGRVKSTARKNPKLVWFTTLPTREDATAMEVELKKLVDINPREIRRMFIGFRDLVQELGYS